MMSTRLQASKELLKKDGVLICAIDQHEVNRLGLLLEEVFAEYFIYLIPIQHNPRSQQGTNFGVTHEYMYFCIPSNEKGSEQDLISKEKLEEPEWRDFMQTGSASDRNTSKIFFIQSMLKMRKLWMLVKSLQKTITLRKKSIKLKKIYTKFGLSTHVEMKKMGY